MYLTVAVIAADPVMRMRVAACAAQEGVADAGIAPDTWTFQWSLVWAAAPGWAEAWESAQAAGKDNIGADPAVVTDAMILTQVQAMRPFTVIAAPPPGDPRKAGGEARPELAAIAGTAVGALAGATTGLLARPPEDGKGEEEGGL